MRPLHSFLLFPALLLPTAAAAASSLPVPGRSLSSALTQRQSQCVDLCTSSSDIAALSSFAGCNTSDLNCICAAIEALSQACLFCILELDGIDVTTVQSTCGGASGVTIGGAAPTDTGTGKPTSGTDTLVTSAAGTQTQTFIPQTTSTVPINVTACDGVCSGTADAAASKDVLSCESAGTDPTCICNAMSKLSRACFFCMLQTAGISESTYETLCAFSLSSLSSQPSSTQALTNTLGTLTPASTLIAGGSKVSGTGAGTGTGTQTGAAGAGATGSGARGLGLGGGAGGWVGALLGFMGLGLGAALLWG
ncbi:hypothetical protein CALCODRAFT_503214 [Calocera cornea HHB12733]|uniref:Extracellular membrane protein CFEM domain-containing protein n=1 Tax=Calocera cornea HHB12733 TaxID=1353952 RepID=A0A165CYQ9_9BASI|nr:hypothetical protein CALCODRAFT_503214 [Calocera cornea HHB12733]